MTSKYQLTEQEFLSKFEIPDFVLKTQQQIAKDFERSGELMEGRLLNETQSLEDLIDLVGEILSKVLKKGERSTLQLLYQIDIPQAQFLRLTTDENFLQKVSLLIIKREAQKVYLRSIL